MYFVAYFPNPNNDVHLLRNFGLQIGTRRRQSSRPSNVDWPVSCSQSYYTSVHSAVSPAVLHSATLRLLENTLAQRSAPRCDQTGNIPYGDHKPPSFSPPRHLAPSRFHSAKSKFNHMLELCIIRPSSCSWAFSQHVVPGAIGNWWPFRDNRAIDRVMVLIGARCPA